MAGRRWIEDGGQDGGQNGGQEWDRGRRAGAG